MVMYGQLISSGKVGGKWRKMEKVFDCIIIKNFILDLANFYKFDNEMYPTQC